MFKSSLVLNRGSGYNVHVIYIEMLSCDQEHGHMTHDL